VLGFSGGERDLAFALLFGVAALALPMWVWLANKWDKRRAYQVGIAILAISLVVLTLVSRGQTVWALVIAALAGIGLSAAHAIPLAIVPDTLDWDEVRKGTRQEAACYAVLTLAQKLISAATITLTGTLLSAASYVPNPGPDTLQPNTALDAIRFLTGWLPAVIFLMGIILSFVYPLTRQKHARILRVLEKRRPLSALSTE